MTRLKDLIKRWFFKEELDSFNESANRFVEAYKQLQKRNDTLEHQLAAAKDALDPIFHKTIVGYDKNKAEELVWIVKQETDNCITLYLYEPIRQRGKPRVYITKKTTSDGKNYFHIDDIIAEDENLGNGSILLNAVQAEAQKLHVQFVSGMLSPVDQNVFDKLEHFYKKNGFEVSFDEDRSSGKIRKVVS